MKGMDITMEERIIKAGVYDLFSGNQIKGNISAAYDTQRTNKTYIIN